MQSCYNDVVMQCPFVIERQVLVMPSSARYFLSQALIKPLAFRHKRRCTSPADGPRTAGSSLLPPGSHTAAEQLPILSRTPGLAALAASRGRGRQLKARRVARRRARRATKARRRLHRRCFPFSVVFVFPRVLPAPTGVRQPRKGPRGGE